MHTSTYLRGRHLLRVQRASSSYPQHTSLQVCNLSIDKLPQFDEDRVVSMNKMSDDFDDAAYVAAFDAIESSGPISRPAPPVPTRAPAPDRAAATSGPKGVQQPKPQVLANRSQVSSILVSARQKGNPILKHVTAFSWEYADIPADYVLGNTTCALFLSLKYHRIHPEYVYARIRALGGKYNLRILLAMVDIQNHEEALKELAKTSMINNLTLMLCWTAQEAGHYLDLYKSLENIQPGQMRHTHTRTYKESLEEFVTVPRSINKSDARGLISQFGNLKDAVNAQPEQLSAIPGWGDRKVQQWRSAVREPFRIPKAARSGPGLSRMGTTLGENESPQPIPIGAAVSNRATAVPNPPTRANSRSAGAIGLDDDDDDEALLAAVEAEERRASELVKTTIQPSSNLQEAQEGADGVMAALQRLREND